MARDSVAAAGPEETGRFAAAEHEINGRFPLRAQGEQP
jgi:hypothetical protein